MKIQQTTDQSRLPGVSRRKFLAAGGAAAAAAFTIVPRHVLGGAGFVAPSSLSDLAKPERGTSIRSSQGSCYRHTQNGPVGYEF